MKLHAFGDGEAVHSSAAAALLIDEPRDHAILLEDLVVQEVDADSGLDHVLSVPLQPGVRQVVPHTDALLPEVLDREIRTELRATERPTIESIHCFRARHRARIIASPLV